MTALASLRKSLFGPASNSTSGEGQEHEPTSPPMSADLPSLASSSSPPSALFDKLRCFDDWDALESGEALEFIPQEWLESPEKWWMCRVSRRNKVEFTLSLEYNAEKTRGSEPAFMLSARRVGNDFYISRYEDFPTEWSDSNVPTGRYCAVLKGTTGFLPRHPDPPPLASSSSSSLTSTSLPLPQTLIRHHETKIKALPIKAGERRSFELVPASLVSTLLSPKSRSTCPHHTLPEPLATIHHSWFAQPNCGAEVKTLEASLVANNRPCDDLKQEAVSAAAVASSSSSSAAAAAGDGGVYAWGSGQARNSSSNNSVNRSSSNGSVNSQASSREGSSSSSSSSSSNISDKEDGARRLSARSSCSHHGVSAEKNVRRKGTSTEEGNDWSSDGKSDVGVRRNGSIGSGGKVTVLSQIPTWNPEAGCLVMKFERNRVTKSSSKNFILSREANSAGRWASSSSSSISRGSRSSSSGKDGTATKTTTTRHESARTSAAANSNSKVPMSSASLQFGKREHGEYALDFVAPVAPLQAFALALSAFAFKP